MSRYNRWERVIRESAKAGTFEGLTAGEMRAVGASLDVVQTALEQGAASPGLVCPDDEGMIRTVNASSFITSTPGVLAAGGSFTITVPAIGIMSDWSLGLYSGTFTGAYTMSVQRAGVTVGSLTSAMLAAATANSVRATNCRPICQGPIQTLSVVVTVGAAVVATDVFTWNTCRTYGPGDPQHSTHHGGGGSCSTGSC